MFVWSYKDVKERTESNVLLRFVHVLTVRDESGKRDKEISFDLQEYNIGGSGRKPRKMQEGPRRARV